MAASGWGLPKLCSFGDGACYDDTARATIEIRETSYTVFGNLRCSARQRPCGPAYRDFQCDTSPDFICRVRTAAAHCCGPLFIREMPVKSSLSLFDLSGKVALVTGAAGGLGNAIVDAFAAHGADVLVSDVNAAAAAKVAELTRAHGVRAEPLACDLSRPHAAREMAGKAIDAFGRIDILVCNAGMQGPAGPLLDVGDAAWEATFQVNLKSAHELCAAVLPQMTRGGGSVVLMTSIAALRGNGAIGLYGLTKAALSQLARNLAVEWGPKQIRVNAIAPGLIRTPLARELMANEAFMARRIAATPLRRVGEPHEIAGVAVMLASAAGAFITGQTIVVDGGTLVSDGS